MKGIERAGKLWLVGRRKKLMFDVDKHVGTPWLPIADSERRNTGASIPVFVDHKFTHHTLSEPVLSLAHPTVVFPRSFRNYSVCVYVF